MERTSYQNWFWPKCPCSWIRAAQFSRSGGRRNLGSCGGKKCTRTPWNFPIKLVRTRSFRPGRPDKWKTTLYTCRPLVQTYTNLRLLLCISFAQAQLNSDASPCKFLLFALTCKHTSRSVWPHITGLRLAWPHITSLRLATCCEFVWPHITSLRLATCCVFVWPHFTSLRLATCCEFVWPPHHEP